MQARSNVFALGIAGALFVTACGRSGPPYDPDVALSTFQLEEGFRIELFASEPLIADPVAMEFDEQGRVYVVEMPGYPMNAEPVGRIRLLEDTDGDGYPDESQIFADDLVLPTGVMRWKRGILVTAAPDIIYFEDSDGDGIADIRDVLLTGFAFTNPQHTVNSPIYGLDNWIYLAHEGSTRAIIFPDEFGDPGSAIRYADGRESPQLDPTRRGVRFQPDRNGLEYLSGRSQFGHTFDEWGRYFTVDNSNHARQEVIGARYLARNDFLMLPSAMVNASDHGSAARVFPISENPRVELLTEFGQFTSACGLTRYLGGVFPDEYRRASFVAEPVHNLVHVDFWSEEGATSVARRGRENIEFLASTDGWFRPVNFYVGPDGALYLVDYYRESIEHPEWMSSEHHHDSPDLYTGTERGRIFRLVPDIDDPPPPPGRLSLAESSTRELVAHLSHPNVWWRRNAQRLLVDRQDAASVDHLEELFRTDREPLGRLHALWTLEGLRSLDEDLLLTALEDDHPGVRENTIRLSEPLLELSHRLREKLLSMIEEPSARARFQLLLTLGNLSSAAAIRSQNQLLERDFDDPWVQLAAMSSSADRAVELFDMGIQAAEQGQSESVDRFAGQVTSVLGARQEGLGRVLRTVAGSDRAGESWQAASLEGLARGIRAVGSPSLGDPSHGLALLELFERGPTRVRRGALELLRVVGLPRVPETERLLQSSGRIIESPDEALELRVDCLRLLALAPEAIAAERLVSLLNPVQPEEVQGAAIEALGKQGEGNTGGLLISRWNSFPLSVRRAAARALLSNADWTLELVAALREERVPPWSLNFGGATRFVDAFGFRDPLSEPGDPGGGAGPRRRHPGGVRECSRIGARSGERATGVRSPLFEVPSVQRDGNGSGPRPGYGSKPARFLASARHPFAE